MAKARVRLHYAGIGAAMRSGVVRAKLRQVAGGIASSARGIDSAEGGGARITVEEGTRPGGRPFARAVSDAADAEFGTSNTARRRTLGRAANLPNS